MTEKPYEPFKGESTIAFLMLIPLMLLGSFVLKCFWVWYAPILWPAVPILTFSQCFCFIMLRSVAIPPAKVPLPVGKGPLHPVIESIVFSGVWLIIGWIIYRLFFA